MEALIHSQKSSTTKLTSPSAQADTGKVQRRRQQRQLPGLGFEVGQQSMNLLTANEVAQYLRMPRPTVYFHTKEGRIPSIKIGGRIRYSMPEIEQILKRGMAPLEREDTTEGIDGPSFTVNEVIETNSVRQAGKHVVFAGLPGDDPALQAWLQWSIKCELNPVVVPLQQYQAFVSLNPKIIFIDLGALNTLKASELCLMLDQIFNSHNDKSQLVFMHEPELPTGLMKTVLSRGPVLLCPKNPDKGTLRRIEEFAVRS